MKMIKIDSDEYYPFYIHEEYKGKPKDPSHYWKQKDWYKIQISEKDLKWVNEGMENFEKIQKFLKKKMWPEESK